MRDLVEARDALLQAQNDLVSARVSRGVAELDYRRAMETPRVTEDGIMEEIHMPPPRDRARRGRRRGIAAAAEAIAAAEADALANRTADGSNPVGRPAKSIVNTAGCTNRMWDLVRNVIAPANGDVPNAADRTGGKPEKKWTAPLTSCATITRV